MKKNCVTVGITGGLGNQMFQYAFYKNLQKLNCNAMFDISYYDIAKSDHGDVHNGFELERIFEIDMRNMMRKRTFIYKVLQKLKIKNKRVYENEIKNKSQEGFVELKNSYLCGYWVNPCYRTAIAEDLANIFKFKVPLDGKNLELANEIGKCNAVSIHVRHGDYLRFQNIFKILDLDYYKDAIAYIKKKVDNPIFYCFSDDIDWCKNNFTGGESVVFVENNIGQDSYIDMQLMSLCQHNIIANSTFSMWGAMLNKNVDKIVLAPEVYHNDSSMNELNWEEYGMLSIKNK